MTLYRDIGWLLALALFVSLPGCAQTADDFIASARGYMSDGRDREAAIDLKNALVAAPDSADANFLLGKLLVKVGNPGDAQLTLERALKLGRSPGDVLPVLAEALLEVEKHAEAVEVLNVNLSLDSKTMARIAVLRGKAYLGQGSLLEARTQFQLALNDLPSDARLGFVHLATASNDRNAAHAHLDDVLADDPGNADAWVARGDLFRSEGRAQEALAAFRQAIRVDPGHVVAMLSEALVLITRNELEAAGKSLDRAAAIAPLKPMLDFARALLAFKEKRYEDARAALQRVLTAVPTYAPALLLAGSLDYATEKYELAQNSYVAYLTHNPGNVYARKMLAATLMAKGQPHFAANVLDPVLGNSEDPELLALAGRAFLVMGLATRAAELLKKAVALAPSNADLKTSLGITYLASRLRAQARAEFESAIALKPTSARPDYSLTMMLIADQQPDRAEKIALAAAQRLPQAPEGPMLQGAVQLARGNDASARVHFERALAMLPTYLPAAEALADIERRAGDSNALQRRIEGVLRHDPKHVEALLMLARLDMEQGRGERGIAGVRQILTEHPRALPALLMLARLQMSIGKPQDAIATARRAADEHPWDAGTLDLLAHAQVAAGEIQAGLLTLERLSRLRPDDAEPQLRVAAVHAASGKLRSAHSTLNSILRAHPRNIAAQALLGEVLIGLERTDEALHLARSLQKSAPAAPEGYRLEGDVLLAIRASPASAVAVYSRAFDFRPGGDLLIRVHRARTLASGKSMPTDSLRDWLARNPQDMTVRLYLADVYSESGQYSEAAAEYAKLLQQTPENARLLNNLAWAMHQLGDENALAHAEKAAKLRPDEARFLDTVGNILLAQGKASRAAQVLLEAQAKAPEDPEVRLSLAKALINVGDIGRARMELAALVRSNGATKEGRAAQALLAELHR
jgi:putative PEP-CTERM system TPR-repeat lipoprotein